MRSKTVPTPITHRAGIRCRHVALPLFMVFCFCGLFLCACGEVGTEYAQRGEFIKILQRNVLAKRGIRFPMLTEEEKSAIGPYTRHYELLNSLSDDEELLMSLKDLPSLQRDLMTSSDPVEKKQLILKAEGNLLDIKEKLISAYKKTRDAKATLSQPQDLKSVYDEAFLKVVHAPTDMLVEIIEKSLDASGSAMALNDYILEHPDAAEYRGSSVLIRNPEAELYVRSLLEDYREKSERALQTLRELNSLTW